MGQPKDALDVTIRLFLLGLALPRTQAERSLGHEFFESADRLGMIGECPVDSSLLVSLVQLFPLDAEALLPPPPPPPSTWTSTATATSVPAAAAEATARSPSPPVPSGRDGDDDDNSNIRRNNRTGEGENSNGSNSSISAYKE